ncbi:DUF502 domain-containing protein [Bremerella alba]|uniref:DUF502 domain-containing protein n=1 Tax=Bremerella alba TaxID=980252 RepID=A0A7V9A985_9BACT|nr:DUF502 domain-containing protein [Bremerella alba]MBA2117083.1 hypothetical protein [Bremerella alba]
MASELTKTDPKKVGGFYMFRRAVLRGLAIAAPPLLTIVIFIWIFTTIQSYILAPIETTARSTIAWVIQDVHRELPNVAPEETRAEYDSEIYRKTANGQWVPEKIYNFVYEHLHDQPMPASGYGVYEQYVQYRWLKRELTIPSLFAICLLALYFTGKFLAGGLGRMIWNASERHVMQRLPIIRNVYGSVKQVTDFLLNEQEIQFTRVVAVEYPRKGMWSLGFVTSESLLDIKDKAGEPVITILIPTSPMPATGFTINAKKSETIELNITLDQAFQFIVSCGVVVPPQQQTQASPVAGQIQARLKEKEKQDSVDEPQQGNG